MRVSLIFFLILAISLPFIPQTNFAAVQAQDACSGLVESRLSAGMTARVVLDGDGIGTILRNGPGKEQSGSSVIRALPEGEIVELVDGPVCLDGLVTWEVKLISGEEGWVPEGDALRYILEPFDIGQHVFRRESVDAESLSHWYVTYSGMVTQEDPVPLPVQPPAPASEIWQQSDLDAAAIELADRRANCPEVLQGTPWENETTAGDVTVPSGTFDVYPSPDGTLLFAVNHRVLPIPTCGGSPGVYYGISNVMTLRDDGEVIDLFPYGQHSGARSTEACHSADVPDLAWTTYLDEIVWSPDSDTVALTVRYLQYADPVQRCAYYYVFLVDVLNARIDPIAEGRRPGWGSGGSRLYYFTMDIDNGYNILDEQLLMLSEGQTTSINIAEDVQFVPRSLNSTGVILPWSEDGRHALACTTFNGCPATVDFEVSTTNPAFAEPVPVPENLLPYQIASVLYVAGDTRLLWLTTDNRLYLQGLEGVGAGLIQEIVLNDPAAANGAITHITPLPTGVAVILHLSNGNYFLLNTLDRRITHLQDLTLLP